MATGVYPIDPTTAVGLFRTEIGDVVTTSISGATAEYEYISDAQIQALLDQYPDSRNTALGRAMSMMATQMIAAAQDIQVDDIRIKTVERAKLMMEQANVMLGVALRADADAGFSVVPLSMTTRGSAPQGTPNPWQGVM